MPRKWTTRIFHYDCYFYAKFAKNTWKLYISVKPKILPEERYKTKAEGECFAPLFKIYLKIICFFHAWAIFNWIFDLLDSKNWFCKFFIFLHFCAGCRKNYLKAFRIQILIFIWSNHSPMLSRKWTDRISHYDCYFHAKFAKNTWKLYISVKPKILPEGRYKTKAEGECFAPLFKIYLKIIFFLRAWIIFNWILTSWFQKIDFANFSFFAFLREW